MLAISDLVKHFGSVKANDGISLEFRSGEVHALLGENGAGKSTLIKILAGLYEADSGEILLDGTPVHLDTAMEARRSGISVVHQDSMLVSQLTVLENVVLQEGGLGPVSPDLGNRLIESGRRLGFELDPRYRVGTLTAGDRQRVEIARALMADARFLILDEPTAVLSPREKAAFFALLARLAADGIGIIFVTHHIGDALRYAQRVTVLRAGKVIDDSRRPAGDLTEPQVIRMMVGEVAFHVRDPRAHRLEGEVVLEAIDVGGELEGAGALEHVTLHVRAGEVLGIAGVEGDGQRELAAALIGAWTPQRGAIKLKGRPMQDYSPSERARLIADVPDDQMIGTVEAMSVWENAGITQLAWHRPPTPGHKRRVKRRSAELVEQFGIHTPSVHSLVGRLSGGNRRRVVLARELSKTPEIAVLAFATKGLDVRSVEHVKEWTRRLADAEAAVVYISADLEEVMAVSDRIAVLAHGRITGTLRAEDADVHTIGRLMLGGFAEEQEAIS